MSLRKTEKRPASQLINKQHKKRKFETLEKRLKKQKRVGEQRDYWVKLQNQGETTDPKWVQYRGIFYKRFILLDLLKH